MGLCQAVGNPAREKIGLLIELVFATRADRVAAHSHFTTSPAARIGVMPEVRIAVMCRRIDQFLDLGEIGAWLAHRENARPAFIGKQNPSPVHDGSFSASQCQRPASAVPAALPWYELHSRTTCPMRRPVGVGTPRQRWSGLAAGRPPTRAPV